MWEPAGVVTGADRGVQREGTGGADFFISYTGIDRAWAEWIAWQLEAAGYRVLVQAWDFGAGAHFVTEMHQAAQNSLRTVAVLSAAYLGSAYAEAEWQAAWEGDPTGKNRKLLVFRIEDCPRPGLLRQLVTVDLFDLQQDVARARLLAAAEGTRGKPQAEPVFPGSSAPLTARAEPAFPGQPADLDFAASPSRRRWLRSRLARVTAIIAAVGIVGTLTIMLVARTRDPCRGATVSIEEPRDGEDIDDAISVRGQVSLGCQTNGVWLLDKPVGGGRYYTNSSTSLPVQNRQWEKSGGLCVGGHTPLDIGTQHELIALVVTAETTKSLEDSIRNNAANQSAYFIASIPPSVARASVKVTITRLAGTSEHAATC